MALKARHGGHRGPAGWAVVALSVGLLVASVALRGQEPAAARTTWDERDSRLANQYIRLLQTKPEFGQALNLLWDLYQKHGSTHLLVEHFAAQRSNPVAEVVYAHLLRKSGAEAEAAEVYEAVLRRDPDNPFAADALIELAVERGDLDTASELLGRTATRADGAEASQRYFRLADLLMGQGRDADAAEALEQAIEAAGQADPALLRAAASFRQVGQVDRAVTLLERVLERTTDPARRLELLGELAGLHRMAGDTAAAASALRSGLAATHYRHHIHRDLFRQLVRLFEEDQQSETLERELIAAAQAPDAGEPELLAIVSFYELSARPALQLEWTRRLQQRFPGDPDHQRALVDCLVANDAYDEAAEVLERLIASAGQRSLTLRLLRCEIESRRGRRVEATGMLDAVIADFGTEGEAGERILAFAESQYFDAAAERLLAERAEGKPGSPETVFAFARFLLARSQDARARSVLEEYVRQAGGSDASRLQAMNEVTRFLLGLEKLELAQAFGEEAMNAGGGDPEALVQLAEIHFEQGDREFAVSRLESAWRLAADPLLRQQIDQKILSYLEHAFLESQQAAMDRARRIDLFFPGSQIVRPGGSAAPGAEGGDEAQPRHAAESIAFARRVADEASEDAAPPAALFRAAWWAFRVDAFADAYEWMRRLVEAAPDWKDIPFLQLQLDLARASGNSALAERTLDELRRLEPDAGRSASFARQLADHKLERGLFEEAIEILEEEIRKFPYEAQLLEALTLAYEEGGRSEDALELWRVAFEQAPDAVARAQMLEPYVSTLTIRGRTDIALEAITRVMREESDVAKRRTLLERQMAIIDASRNGVGSLTPRELLEQLRARFREIQARQPFDPFYPEALAQVHEALDDAESALSALRQAYYNSAEPSAPVLEKLRDMALAQGDGEAALGFQRQLIFTTGKESDIGEWRVLVRMMDAELRLEEGDRIRERLERRFAGDPDVLQELVQRYLDGGRSEQALRVAERLAELRPWHMRGALQRAQLYLERGRPQDALAALEPALNTLENDDESGSASGLDPAEFLDWTFAWELPGGSTGTGIAVPPIARARGVDDALGGNDFFRALERARLSDYLKRIEVPEGGVPGEARRLRLAAISTAARAAGAIGGPTLDEWIRRWSGDDAPPDPAAAFRALHSCGADDLAFPIAWNSLSGENSEAALFHAARIALQFARRADVAAWVSDEGVPASLRDKRWRYFAGTMELLSALGDDAADSGFVREVADAGMLAAGDVWEIAVAAYAAGDPRRALELGAIAVDAAEARGMQEDADYHLMFAEWARQVGDFEGRLGHLKAWLRRVAGEPAFVRDTAVRTVRGQGGRFFSELAGILRWIGDPAEREELLDLARGSASTDAPGLGDNPASTARATLIEEFLLLTTAADGEGIDGPERTPVIVLPRSLQFRSPAEFWHEMNDMVALWELFGGVDVAVDFAQRLDATTIAPFPGDAGDDFYVDFSATALLRRMAGLAPQEQVRLVAHYLATKPMGRSETLAVGLLLSAYGYDRAAIPLFERMVEIEPGEAQHAEYLTGACQASGDLEPLLRYYRRVIVDNELRVPGNPRAETFSGEYGRTLRMAGDEETLRQFAASAPPVPSGRSSLNRPEVPYMAELAGYYQESGRPDEAVAILRDLIGGLAGPTDMAAIRLAHGLRLAGRHDEALATLESLDLAKVPEEMVGAAATEKARVHRLAGDRDGLRKLAATAITLADPSAIVAVAREAADAGLAAEALALLELAGRGETRKPMPAELRWEVAVTALEIIAAEQSRLAAAQSDASGGVELDRAALERLALPHFERMLRSSAPSDPAARRLAALAVNAAEDGVFVRTWSRLRTAIPMPSGASALLCDVLFGDPGARAGRVLDDLASARDVDSGVIDAAMEAMVRRGQLAPAERLWRRAIAQGPSVAPTRPWHLEIFARTGQEDELRKALRPLMLENWTLAPFGPEAGTFLAAAGNEESAEAVFARFWDRLRPANRTLAIAQEEASLTGRWFEDAQLRMLRLRGEFADLLDRYTRFLIDHGRIDEAENLMIEGWEFLPPGRAGEAIHEFYRRCGVPPDERARRLAPFHLTTGVRQSIRVLDSGGTSE